MSERRDNSKLPARPLRGPCLNCTGEQTQPYRRGMSAAANGRGYTNPYAPGAHHDDYLHGYLNAVALAQAIERHKRETPALMVD